MDRKRIRGHIQANHDTDGNGWCNVGTCEGFYQGLPDKYMGATKARRQQENGRSMVPQQAINIERHLEKVHGMYSYFCIYIIYIICCPHVQIWFLNIGIYSYGSDLVSGASLCDFPCGASLQLSLQCSQLD